MPKQYTEDPEELLIHGRGGGKSGQVLHRGKGGYLIERKETIPFILARRYADKEKREKEEKKKEEEKKEKAKERQKEVLKSKDKQKLIAELINIKGVVEKKKKLTEKERREEKKLENSLRELLELPPHKRQYASWYTSNYPYIVGDNFDTDEVPPVEWILPIELEHYPLVNFDNTLAEFVKKYNPPKVAEENKKSIEGRASTNFGNENWSTKWGYVLDAEERGGDRYLGILDANMFLFTHSVEGYYGRGNAKRDDTEMGVRTWKIAKAEGLSDAQQGYAGIKYTPVEASIPPELTQDQLDTGHDDAGNSFWHELLPKVYYTEPTDEVPYKRLIIQFGKVKEGDRWRPKIEYIITPFTPLTFEIITEINNNFLLLNKEVKKLIPEIKEWHKHVRGRPDPFVQDIFEKLEVWENYSPRVIIYGRGTISYFQYEKLVRGREEELDKIIAPLIELKRKQGILLGTQAGMLYSKKELKEIIPTEKAIVKELKVIDREDKKKEVIKDPPTKDQKTEFTKWKSGFCSLFGKVKDQTYDDLFSIWLFLYPNIPYEDILKQPSTDKELDDLLYYQMTGEDEIAESGEYKKVVKKEIGRKK